MLSKSEKVVNPFPNKPWFLHFSRKSLLKTQWKKEKLLVTSNFSFSHSVLNPFGDLSAIFMKLKIVICKRFHFGRVQNLSFEKGLNACIIHCIIHCTKHVINTLPNDKILDVTKLKAFADDRINVAQMMIPVFVGLENIVGKGENAGYQHFFKRLLLSGSLKDVIV